jgi:hypothetical protein
MVRVRHVYKHFRPLTPQWDEHLQRLVKRAQQKLPLFPPPPTRKWNNDADEYPRPRLAAIWTPRAKAFAHEDSRHAMENPPDIISPWSRGGRPC